MSRLTYKLNEQEQEEHKTKYLKFEYFPIPDYCIEKGNYGRITSDMIYNKLGKFEDLFELYNINSIEELELALGMYVTSNKNLYSIPISDLEEYRIDKLGNIFSLKKQIYLKPSLNKDGYAYVIINKKQRLIHRLVAITFIDNPNNFKEVNHKNEIKNDNRVENLEWCSRKYNVTYNNCHFRHSEWKKKPILQFTLDGVFVKEWTYSKEIEDSGIAKANLVRQCCRNKLCQTSGFVWRFKGDTFETRRIKKEYDRTKNLGNYARKQKI